MQQLNKLLNYSNIYSLWLSKGSTKEAAVELTVQQLDALEEITENEDSWMELVRISAAGRIHDTWLALDWPEGFDELVLCVPLCKLVNWECSKCTVGNRQENNSCANDYSLFGYIGTLVMNGAREDLVKHIKNARKILMNEKYLWNIHKCEPELLRT